MRPLILILVACFSLLSCSIQDADGEMVADLSTTPLAGEGSIDGDPDQVSMTVLDFIDAHRADPRFGVAWVGVSEIDRDVLHVRYLDESFEPVVDQLAGEIGLAVTHHRGGATFEEMRLLQEQAMGLGLPFSADNEQGLLTVFVDESNTLSEILDGSENVLLADPSTLPRETGD